MTKGSPNNNFIASKNSVILLDTEEEEVEIRSIVPKTIFLDLTESDDASPFEMKPTNNAESTRSSFADSLSIPPSTALSSNGDLESDIFNPDTETFVDDMEPPIRITTHIPKDKTALEVLRAVEIYLDSMRDPIIFSRGTSKRVTRRDEAKASIAVVNRPYVPAYAWKHCTWEDWSQLNVGDILHVPFRSDEVRVLRRIVKRVKLQNHDITLWDHVASFLGGRSAEDCKRFWEDLQCRESQIKNKVMMIRQMKGCSQRMAPRHELVAKRRKLNSHCKVSMLRSLWANMTRETTIHDGSGDAISLAIINNPRTGLNVVAGSLCDENVQYNMPGNLRVWNQETNVCKFLDEHKSSKKSGDIWRTVCDVKLTNDSRYMFSASHDGKGNIYDTDTFNYVSVLDYHKKPINQIAVHPIKTRHVIATCSNDGIASIWYFIDDFVDGVGVVCRLKSEMRQNRAEVECVEFGSNYTENLLFVGVNNSLDRDRPGLVQAFDVVKGKRRIRYDTMKGAVSSLAVSPSGNFLVTGNYNPQIGQVGDGFLHMYDIKTPEITSKFESGHTDVNSVAISPCERYIASANADKEGGEVAVFDIRRPDKKLHVLSHTLSDQSWIAPDSSVGIGGMHWMSDSRTMITGGGDSTVKVWNLAGETTLLKTYPTSNCVTSLRVHEETMTLAVGVAGAQGIVHVWQP